jgi:lipopolysaccharide export system protein LptA
MVCKFCAAARLADPSNPPVPLRSFRLAALLGFLVLALPVGLAHAEKADRAKPLNIESDGDGKGDLIKQIVVFNGNVVVTKGTMTIRAARIELRETPDGYRTAVAFGSPGHHATYRQKRDAPDEWIEGDADRLEYDGKSDVIRFVGDATVRHLRGSTTANELTGNLVTYDSTTEVFNVSGGAATTPANPTGRVRATLMPREGTPAAAEAAAAAASAAAASAPPLRSEPALGAKK